MSDTMFYGVLRMPYEMAMGNDISRIQFYDRVQECAKRCEAAEKLVIELTDTNERLCNTIAGMQARMGVKIMAEARDRAMECDLSDDQLERMAAGFGIGPMSGVAYGRAVLAECGPLVEKAEAAAPAAAVVTVDTPEFWVVADKWAVSRFVNAAEGIKTSQSLIAHIDAHTAQAVAAAYAAGKSEGHMLGFDVAIKHKAVAPQQHAQAALSDGEQPFPKAFPHAKRIELASALLSLYSDTNVEKLLDYEVQPIIRKLAAMIGQWQQAAVDPYLADKCASQPPAAAPSAPTWQDNPAEKATQVIADGIARRAAEPKPPVGNMAAAAPATHPQEAGRDMFLHGVIAALGALAPHCQHGDVQHDEIVRSVGKEALYRAAEPEDVTWAGLDPKYYAQVKK